jgi:hypothetical protein
LHAARRSAVRLRAGRKLIMRFQFWLLLLVVTAGIVYFTTLGVLHR